MATVVVGIGGSTRADSATERALLLSLKAAEDAGARTQLFGGAFLAKLPIYGSEGTERTVEQREFVDAVRARGRTDRRDAGLSRRSVRV